MERDEKIREIQDEYKKVFQGIDKFKPYLLKDWLIKNGVVAQVRGFDLSTLGALPNMEEFPSVWVPPQQVEEARRLLNEFEESPTQTQCWMCASCGEENPGEFGSCWKCGADSPYLP